MNSTSWKTSAAGLVAILGVVVAHFWPEYLGFFKDLATAAAGAGLLVARDNKVSTEQARAK